MSSNELWSDTELFCIRAHDIIKRYKRLQEDLALIVEDVKALKKLATDDTPSLLVMGLNSSYFTHESLDLRCQADLMQEILNVTNELSASRKR